MPFWAPRCAAKPRVSRSTAVGGVRHHVLLGTSLRCKTTRFAQYGGGWRAAPCPYGYPAAHQNHAFRAVRRWVGGGRHHALMAPRCAAKPRVSRSTAVGGGQHHALLGTPLRCKTTRFAQYGGGWRAAPRPSGHPAALRNHAFRAVRRWVACGTTSFWAPGCAAKPRVSRSTAVGGVRHHVLLGTRLRCETTRFAQYGGG